MSLQLLDVRKSYQQGDLALQILKGINVEIKTGEIVAIIGESGSGKSTLLSLLAGLDKPDAGQILISGDDITGMDQKRMTEFRGRKIGIVFQQFHLLLHLTALENVALPLEIANDPFAEIKAKEMLSQVGLSNRLNHFPSQLSGGECQRVALARALVGQPEILLADEPSGNLDIKTGQQVMNIFMDVVRRNKITTVLVTHSLELAERCDRKLKLADGVL
jgi:putative ABC transport system ATP-binding protein